MKILYLTLLLALGSSLFAQKGIENIFVETYYITDEKDSTDILGGQRLKPGTKTYRIFVDMAPGYKMQMVYGVKGHPLVIKSTTKFINNYRGGQRTGDVISWVKLREQTLPLDSWITVGGASGIHQGVPKHLDPDTSIIGGVNNDGGSAQIKGGLLTNMDPEMGIPLTEKDGLVQAENEPLVFFRLEPIEFTKLENNGVFTTEDGVYGVLKGVEGITEENMVLIAQITTEGELSFELNLQLLAPYGGTERFVAKNPDGSDFTHPALIYPIPNSSSDLK